MQWVLSAVHVGCVLDTTSPCAPTCEAHDGVDVSLIDPGGALQVDELGELGDHSNLQHNLWQVGPE